jgi:hypothetical protein
MPPTKAMGGIKQNVGVLGCGPIWTGEGAAAPFNGVHILGEIWPTGGSIPLPNCDGRT